LIGKILEGNDVAAAGCVAAAGYVAAVDRKDPWGQGCSCGWVGKILEGKDVAAVDSCGPCWYSFLSDV